MSADVRVIGVDPGPTPGVVVLDILAGRLVDVGVLQCSAGLLSRLVGTLAVLGPNERVTLLQVERFVTRGRANAAQSLTRDQVGELCGKYPSAAARSAAMVKPWATDTRLERAGLVEATKGMRHARDAARHALFCAVHDAGLPDPLSRDWRSR